MIVGYKKISYVRQIWYVIKYAVRSWIEWQDAKAWAKEYHPGWLHLATKSKHMETRQIYRNKIMKAYQGW